MAPKRKAASAGARLHATLPAPTPTSTSGPLAPVLRATAEGDFFAGPVGADARRPSKTTMLRKAFSFHNEPGFEWDDSATVVKVLRGSQSDRYGIEAGWKVVEVHREPIRRKGDGKHARYHRRIAERIRLKATYHGRYTITFLIPVPDLDVQMLQKQEELLDKLELVPEDDRCRNLEVLEGLGTFEKATLLQRPKACQGLLKCGCDELTVLFGEKTAASVRSSHALWKKLQSGRALDTDALQSMDLEYANSAGDTPLHMASSPTAAGPVVAAAAEMLPGLLLKPNKLGERPLEAMLRRATAAADRSAILKMVLNTSPRAFTCALADGRPLRLGLPAEERKWVEELQPHAVPWTDVGRVLQSKDLHSLQLGYVSLRERVSAAAPDIQVDDSEGVWSFLLCDHCFGGLATASAAGTSGGSERLEHSSISRDRLGSVWSALKLVLALSAEGTVDPAADFVGKTGVVPHSSLKHVAKGLLSATKGPRTQPFDPREPYRDGLLRLVSDLQAATAKRLKSILDSLEQDSPTAAEAVRNDIPCNDLHGLVLSGASIRQAPERLRLDARLAEATEDLHPVPTPEWVLSQQIDVEMVSTLKEAGCIEKARDLVELVGSKSNALSPDRLRFAYLHTAYVWACNGDHLASVTKTIRDVLGLTSADPPCQGAGSFKLLSFRARSEPKGLPRLLEKTGEAAEEEVALGSSPSILRLEPDLSKTAEELQGDQLALLELLTPGCYVCDILGAEVSVGGFDDLLALYQHLRSLTLAKHGCQVVRAKNGFSRAAPGGAGGYRDLKLWLLVASHGLTLVAELQVHLHRVLEQKKFMHLTYECSRGSFDHLHLADVWQRIPPEPEPQRGCCSALCAALTGKGRSNAKVAPESAYVCS